MTKPSSIDLSIITPMFNEEAALTTFFESVKKSLVSVTSSYEIICVNDGSTDNTWPQLMAHAEQDARIKLINLSRNFGKEAALSAGFDFAQGMAAIPLDADLQDPPELIKGMVEKWREGYDVVLGLRVDRRSDSWIKRVTSKGFYKFMGIISETPIPANVGDFRLLDRRVVDCLKLFPEKSRFMKGIFASLGFKECTLEYVRPERVAGETKWNYFSLYGLALDGIISFSTIPLKLSSYIGTLTAFGAFFYGIFLVIRTLIYGIDIPGYASLMVVFLFVSGLILLSLGMIGEYLARVFKEVKNRPIYIVMDKVGFEGKKKP